MTRSTLLPRLTAFSIGATLVLVGAAAQHRHAPADARSSVAGSPAVGAALPSVGIIMPRAGEVLPEAIGRSALPHGVAVAVAAARAGATAPLIYRIAEDGQSLTAWARAGDERVLEAIVSPAGLLTRWLPTRAAPDTVLLHGRLAGSLLGTLLGRVDPLVSVAERMAIAGTVTNWIFGGRDPAARWSGGEYRILYTRELRPNGTAADGKVVGVQVRRGPNLLEAFRFDRGAASGYYDRFGRSLGEAALGSPIDTRWITSRFSHDREHPILGIVRPHEGVDFGAPYGAAVHAAAGGQVTEAGEVGGYGNLVVIGHGDGVETRYGHLSRFAARIFPGARVARGQVIGYVGSTGLSTGPHLHFEVRRDGVALNPDSTRLLVPDMLGGKDGVRFERMLRDELPRLRGGPVGR